MTHWGEERRNMSSIHRTDDYHRKGAIDLFTEYTVCESLARADSPSLSALKVKKPYGALVGAFLAGRGLLPPGCRVCEIGGGYGSLMRGLLEDPGTRVGHVVMGDLSLYLLKKQRRALQPWSDRTSFVCGDAVELVSALSGIHCFILNEMMGDLETWKDVDPGRLPPEVGRFVRQYGLEIPEKGPFHFNLGALSLMEALCRRNVPALLTEHACDPLVPRGMEYLWEGLTPDGYPREIRLTGHSEFTIRFSHLVRVARAWGRTVETGSLLDLLGVENTQKMRFVFRMRAVSTDEWEILYEFLDHAREYRWLLVLPP
jgi:hypothetical protein